MGSVRLYLEGLYRTQLFSNGWNNMVHFDYLHTVTATKGSLYAVRIG